MNNSVFVGNPPYGRTAAELPEKKIQVHSTSITSCLKDTITNLLPGILLHAFNLYTKTIDGNVWEDMIPTGRLKPDRSVKQTRTENRTGLILKIIRTTGGRTFT